MKFKFNKLAVLLVVLCTIFLIAACGKEGNGNTQLPKEEESLEEGNKEEQSNKQVEEGPEIIELTLEQQNERSLDVVSIAEGEGLSYAFYVIKDNEIYERFGYTKDSHFSYEITEPGKYKVRSYVKDKDGVKVQKDTKTIESAF